MRTLLATATLLVAAAQHPCGNPRVGGDSGVLLTTASFDNVTWVPVTGYSFTSADASQWVALFGGATPDTAPWGVYAKLTDINYVANTANISLVWWSTYSTSCTSFAMPVDFVSLSPRGAGPGFQSNIFAGTQTVDGRVVETWANSFNETITLDTSTCTPVWVSATFITDSLGNNVWQGALISNVTLAPPPPSSVFRPASRCM